MKKAHFLILLLIIFLSANGLYAQRLQFGVQAGVGGAKFLTTNKHFEAVNESHYKLPKNYILPSYGSSLYISYKLTDELNIAIVPGLLRSGNRVKLISGSNSSNLDTQLDNFQLPILIEYALVEKFYVTIGPELNYLVDAHLSFANNRNKVLELYENNRLNFGLQVGSYYSLTKNIDLGLNASQMITNTEKIILTNDAGLLIEEIRLKSMSFHLFIRLKI